MQKANIDDLEVERVRWWKLVYDEPNETVIVKRHLTVLEKDEWALLRNGWGGETAEAGEWSYWQEAIEREDSYLA